MLAIRVEETPVQGNRTKMVRAILRVPTATKATARMLAMLVAPKVTAGTTGVTTLVMTTIIPAVTMAAVTMAAVTMAAVTMAAVTMAAVTMAAVTMAAVTMAAVTIGGGSGGNGNGDNGDDGGSEPGDDSGSDNGGGTTDDGSSDDSGSTGGVAEDNGSTPAEPSAAARSARDNDERICPPATMVMHTDREPIWHRIDQLLDENQAVLVVKAVNEITGLASSREQAGTAWAVRTPSVNVVCVKHRSAYR